MKEFIISQRDGVKVSARSSGIFIDCEVGTILISWDDVIAAQQKMHTTLLESVPILNNDGELIGTESVEI